MRLRHIPGAEETIAASPYVVKEYYIKGKIQSSDEEGNIYYYLFHCYYGQKDADAANVMKAKDVLLKGLEKFPKNSRILEGSCSSTRRKRAWVIPPTWCR